jgi:mRNA interferase RelE/StbE
LESIVDFHEHYLDRLEDHPGYKLRVSEFRILIAWDKEEQVLYAVDAFSTHFICF